MTARRITPIASRPWYGRNATGLLNTTSDETSFKRAVDFACLDCAPERVHGMRPFCRDCASGLFDRRASAEFRAELFVPSRSCGRCPPNGIWLLGHVRTASWSSPSTPATARAASTSSCGTCPATWMTVPSMAPKQRERDRPGGRAGRNPPHPAPGVDQTDCTRLTPASEIRSISRPTGWSWPLNSTLSAITTRAMSLRQKTA